jgi:hypothetical protein
MNFLQPVIPEIIKIASRIYVDVRMLISFKNLSC